jgi:hypothetical protein
MKNAWRILEGKPKGERPLGRPRRRKDDNVRIHLGEMRWDGMGCVNVTQGVFRAEIEPVMIRFME